ncbi:MAG: polyketide synthase [Planctomycetes bacterium]|nr:polyketide synthase [Planctomycetota bacterium]
MARALGLGAGAYTLDAACASSLYSIKLACDELRAGRADAMLAGGVSRPDCLYTQMGFTQLRALSKSGRCSPFDAAGDGLLVGEGAGIVMLKRMADAERDGDRIYGVIRGIGLSNDIGGSLIAPDSEGQLRAMREAYRAAGWRPDAVDYVECHGTGTGVRRWPHRRDAGATSHATSRIPGFGADCDCRNGCAIRQRRVTR